MLQVGATGLEREMKKKKTSFDAVGLIWITDNVFVNILEINLYWHDIHTTFREY
jgi:hypothetical protein